MPHRRSTDERTAGWATRGDDSQGLLYVAFGEPYVAMALNSVRTLRETGSRLPVAVVSSTPASRLSRQAQRALGPMQWQHVDIPTDRNREVKTSAIDYTPFARTLMIDCDTEIMRDVSAGFKLLEHFDVCIKLNATGQRDPVKGSYTIDGIGIVAELPHWNSGVLFFRRSEATTDFFRRWKSAHLAIGAPWDQVSLVQAVFQTEARVLSLDDRWNSQGKRPMRQAYIHHYTSAVFEGLRSRVVEAATAVEGLDVAGVDAYLQERLRDRLERRGLKRMPRKLWSRILQASNSSLRRRVWPGGSPHTGGKQA